MCLSGKREKGRTMKHDERKFRRAMKRAFKGMVDRGRRSVVDTTASLREHEVVVLDRNDSEYWYRIGILDPEDATDEELREYFDGMRVVIDSPYDCTGRAFTSHISWHRNPCGLVSYVHAMAVDV